VNPIDEFGPYAGFGKKTNMPAQAFELAAHGTADAPSIGSVKGNFIFGQNSIGKEPADFFGGKLDRQQPTTSRNRIEVLAQQVDNVIRGAAPVKKRTEVVGANKVSESNIVGGWRLLLKGAAC